MNRLLVNILKLGISTGLTLYTIKPILNKEKNNSFDQQPKLRQKFKQIPSGIKKQQQLGQYKQQQSITINAGTQEQRKQTQEAQRISNIQTNTQKENSMMNQNKSHNQNYQVKQQGQKYKKNQDLSNEIVESVIKVKKQQLSRNQAFVSHKCPINVKQYLELFGVKVIYHQQVTDNSVKIKNSQGDVQNFQCTNDTILNQQWILNISNFLNPIRRINSPDQVKAMLQSLCDDQFIIASYIPQYDSYNQSLGAKSPIDTFTPIHKMNLNKIQQQFRRQRYASTSYKNYYILIRDPEIAKSLKINPNKIGEKYVLYKSTPNNGMQVSCLLQNKKFTVKTIPLNGSSNKDLLKKGLFQYINTLNYDYDVQNFLRSIQKGSGPKKILLIYSKQKRPEFMNQLKSIVLKTSKMMKQQIVVVTTQNEKILKKYFQVIPDDFVTIRLIDTNKVQPSLFSIIKYRQDNKRTYSRKVMTGPFTVQNLCNFIKNSSQLNQYYQQKKKLVSIPSIVTFNQDIPHNTIVLHWKYGCKGCQVVLSYFQQIKKILAQINQQKKFKYEIQNPSALKNISFRRFNILNEQNKKIEKDHDVTPKLILHTNGQTKTLDIGKILGNLSKINPQNEQKIHQNIIKQIISEIETNIQQKNQNDFVKSS